LRDLRNLCSTRATGAADPGKSPEGGRLTKRKISGVAAGESTDCFNPRAEALSRKKGHVGAVAFSTIDFSDATVIRKFSD
jgi:hypothetical protein